MNVEDLQPWPGEAAEVDPLHLVLANAHCDHELAALGTYAHDPARVRPGWNSAALLRKGYLTDKKIDAYVKRGFYSEDFREFRRQRMQKKSRRDGNFLRADSGRLIYNPR
jgi:hypothetical protein